MTLTASSGSSTWTFDYYADGKLRKVTDSSNPVFDRAFDYDHVGRLKEARTGSEARGGTAQDGPFRQSFIYDAWENTISYTNRLWTENPVTNAASFTNNRNAHWTYDNEGNLLSNYDAMFGYDAAGRQNEFRSDVFIEGWSTSYPMQSVLEVSQTFDGNSHPVKKTRINRWEEYVLEQYQLRESIETVYYLRSTALGGKVIAELDETGYKRRGYVFVGGMRLATQYVWNPGYGYDVEWVSTSPATGSEYMNNFAGERELDPLGNDVTYPPEPQVVAEPVFYDPKFDQMPLEIQGGPSEEYERANAEWADLMTATFQDIYDRDASSELWQSRKRSAAMAILMNNPNVGVEYQVVINGEVVESGSYFGEAAAEFLNGLNIAVDRGLLSPLSGISAYARGEFTGPIDVVLSTPSAGPQNNRNPDDFRRHTFEKFKADINKCISQIFGKAASKIPEQTFALAPDLDVTFNGRQLADRSALSGKVRSVIAIFDPKKGPNGTVYIQSGAWNLPDYPIEVLEGAYIHEYGNILSYKYGGKDPYKFGDRAGVGKVKDRDTGANFQRCVYPDSVKF